MPGEKLIQSANIWLSCTDYFCRTALVDKFSTQEGSLNCKNISKCGKKWKLKYGIVASTFKGCRMGRSEYGFSLVCVIINQH